MTELLQKAFVEASKLSQTEQDELASRILQELASERKWDEAFANSADVLEQMAKEALAEYHEGKTLPLDPDAL